MRKFWKFKNPNKSIFTSKFVELCQGRGHRLASTIQGAVKKSFHRFGFGMTKVTQFLSIIVINNNMTPVKAINPV